MAFASLVLARSLMRLYIRAGDPTIVLLMVNNAALSDRQVLLVTGQLRPLSVCHPDEFPNMRDQTGPENVDCRHVPVAWFR